MMKTPSEDLFQLIKSLTRQEKRYFKLYAARHAIEGQNKYALLFDAIDAQETYDEAAIREQFRAEAFVRQLHVVKNYLYQNMLNSLRHFHESQSEDRFNIEMRHAELLFNKGLYKQSEKALGKAKALATEHEHFLQLLEVYRWEHQIAHSRNDFKMLTEYVEKGIEEEFALIARYQNFLEFQALNDRVFIPYWQKGAIRNESEKAALRRLFAEPKFQSADHAQSFNARYFYYNARFSYHFFIGELAESYEHVQQLVALFENLDRKRLKGKLVRYFSSALINLYIVQQRLGLFEEIPQTLAKLRNVPAESPDQKRRLFVRSFNLEVDLYLSTGQFTKGIAQISPLEQVFQEYLSAVDKQQRLGVYYNLAYLYFGAGDYNRALDWINLLLQDPDLKTREDIHCFGRIFHLIIHYELGNDQLLEYAVQSASRFLSRRQRLFQVESIMLKLMRRYPRWLTNRDKKRGFRELLQEMQMLNSDEFERRAFEYFDFIAWLESKVQQQSFAEIAKQRHAG